ncbi:expressed unknown protein [Seminavis robusta]|uniref:Uncharacterized protein n=1 Tax=Seminavis robusta TaxID=568900 RepID=A0A9N8DXQ2_9STRA|nr:expressed unknown protein [Seminavis robusta]|eukprot:Sro456_g146710.1 n/a (104) ;mRNA; f:46521-46971
MAARRTSCFLFIIKVDNGEEQRELERRLQGMDFKCNMSIQQLVWNRLQPTVVAKSDRRRRRGRKGGLSKEDTMALYHCGRRWLEAHEEHREFRKSNKSIKSKG